MLRTIIFIILLGIFLCVPVTGGEGPYLEIAEYEKIEPTRLLEVGPHWFVKLTGDTVIYIPRSEEDFKVVICYKGKWFFLDELIEKNGG